MFWSFLTFNFHFCDRVRSIRRPLQSPNYMWRLSIWVTFTLVSTPVSPHRYVQYWVRTTQSPSHWSLRLSHHSGTVHSHLHTGLYTCLTSQAQYTVIFTLVSTPVSPLRYSTQSPSNWSLHLSHHSGTVHSHLHTGLYTCLTTLVQYTATFTLASTPVSPLRYNTQPPSHWPLHLSHHSGTVQCST